MEIEIRAKVSNPSEITKRVKKLKGVFFETSSQHDTYYKHKSDRKRQLVLRIRKTPKGSMLTFKQKAKGKDTAWPDIDLSLREPKVLEQILLSSDYEVVLKINKTRKSFMLGNLEINIDTIKNLGVFIELETKASERQREKVEKKMKKLLTQLGIAPKDIIEEGYVQLMLKNRP